jgi:tartrate dehydratase alpha subunit/fumarate hydratase class I-like protein
MLKLRDTIVELYGEAATSLPRDVEAALQSAYKKELKGSNAKTALFSILKNIKIARDTGRPICQDTGTASITAWKGESVLTGADDAPWLARGVFDAGSSEQLGKLFISLAQALELRTVPK